MDARQELALRRGLQSAVDAGNAREELSIRRQLGAAIPQAHNGPLEPEPTQSNAPLPFLKGLRDPIDAAAQMLEKAVPESVSSSINALNNWLVERGLPLELIPDGGLSAQLEQQERAYQATRDPDAGFDWARLGGNILSPANLAAASRIPQAATLSGKVATGLAGGAALGPVQAPTFGEDYWQQKGEQAAFGAAGGAIAPAVTTAASRVIGPKVGEAVQALRDQGVKTTIGQRLGGLAKDIEDKATSIPGLGHLIQGRRAEGYEDFNRSIINRTLANVGKELPGDIETGHRAMAYMQSELGKSYDDLLETMSAKIDPELQTDVGTVFEMAKTLPDDIQRYLSGVVEREINKRVTDYGTMSGRSLKNIQSALSNEIASIKNPTGWDIQKKQALMEIKDSFMRMVERQNAGEKTDQLRRINQSWRDSEILNRAASSVGAEGGLFTPAQLYSASKALDRSKNKRAFAQGRAALQPYAGAGKAVLPSKVPDSGTAGRMMIASPLAGLGSSLIGLPFMPLYSKAGAKAADALTTKRPALAYPIADLIEKSGRFAIPGGAAFGATVGGSQ